MELTEADTSVQALLLLFTAYYLMDLNCPNQPVQMLRPVQQLCLNIDSLESQRSTSYMQFKEALMFNAWYVCLDRMLRNEHTWFKTCHERIHAEWILLYRISYRIIFTCQLILFYYLVQIQSWLMQVWQSVLNMKGLTNILFCWYVHELFHCHVFIYIKLYVYDQCNKSCLLRAVF